MDENLDIYYFDNKTMYHIRDGALAKAVTFEIDPIIVMNTRECRSIKDHGYSFIAWSRMPMSPEEKLHYFGA